MSNEHSHGSSPDDDLTRTESSPGANSGRSIGSYRLLQRLGQGGMGEVWLAEQSRPVRRQVAVKVIRTGMDTAQVVARFNVERQALAMMEHSSVAKILDAGTTPEGQPYFAMEYVRGEPITQYCDRQRLSLPERLRLFIALCEGVQHAHQKGIIHRDLKPSNILVSVQGDRAVPRIIDFGIAKAIAQPLTDGTLLTELGALIGTPEYMSPEQAEMTSLDLDTRTDVYSLGVILFELLTGALPFDMQALRAAGLDAVRRTIRETDPPRPSTRVTRGGQSVAANRGLDAPRLASALRGDLDWIVLKALEKDRTRRYDSAAAFALDIRHYLSDEPVRARPPSTTYRMGKFIRRHKIGVVAASAIFLLLIATSVITLVQARRLAGERNRADREAIAARQVADFLASLFKVSDPGEAQGATITAREILAKGARDIGQKLRDQPDVRARLQSIIGDVYTSLGMYAEAEPLLSAAIETQRATRGPADAETITTVNRLANLKWFQEKLDEAEPLYREVVEHRRRTLGEEHRDTLAANFDLASLYILGKRYAEGEALALRTVELQQRVLGPDDPDTLNSWNNLQSLYYRQGRYKEAEPIATRVLESKRRLRGDNHPLTIQSVHNLGTIYMQLHRYDRAEPLLLKAAEDFRRVLGEDHGNTFNTWRALGEMYRSQGRYAQAEPYALRAYTGYVRTLGPRHARTVAIATEIEEMYRAWGKLKEASEWRARSPQNTEAARAAR